MFAFCVCDKYLKYTAEGGRKGLFWSQLQKLQSSAVHCCGPEAKLNMSEACDEAGLNTMVESTHVDRKLETDRRGQDKHLPQSCVLSHLLPHSV